MDTTAGFVVWATEISVKNQQFSSLNREWILFFSSSQLHWYASVAMTVCFAVFAFKLIAQSRLNKAIREDQRASALS